MDRRVDIDALERHVSQMAEYGFSMRSRAGREIAAAFAENATPVAALERLDPPPPTLHLYAQPADPEFLDAQRRYAAERGWFRVHRLDARSHFPMFEVPGEVSAAVEEFVAAL